MKAKRLINRPPVTTFREKDMPGLAISIVDNQVKQGNLSEWRPLLFFEGKVMQAGIMLNKQLQRARAEW